MTPRWPVLSRWRRALRSWGGQRLRKWGWLPEGIPDGLGQDAELLGGRIAQRVVVYFAGTSRNLYQLRQWYEPLVALDAVHPVLLVAIDSRVGRQLAAEAPLPSVTIARFATLDDVLSRSDVALFCYVGQEPGNFHALRVQSALHVFLSHGESDKKITVSNQIKAYDYAFVAGHGAVDRFVEHLLRYDVAHHTLEIGRPQLDGVAAGPRQHADGEPFTVLYAPTWEGAQGTSDYSSVTSLGEVLVRALLEDGRFRVIYRPHPRTGANRAEFQAADAQLRRLVAAAAGSWVDQASDPVAAFAAADILVADVSAIAMDWLATGRPLVVTTPWSATAEVAKTRLLDAVPRLGATDVPGAPALLLRELTEDPGQDIRAELLRYYFGDPALGTGTERFVQACSQVIAERDALVARRQQV